MYRSILSLAAVLLFAVTATAQGPAPGPGRQIHVTPADVTSVTVIAFEGLDCSSENGDTGTIFKSNDGGATWTTDGSWQKSGGNVKHLDLVGGLQYTYTGAGDCERTEGDVLDPDAEDPDIGDWENPS